MLSVIVSLVVGCAGCAIDTVGAVRVERPSAGQPQVPPNVAVGCAHFVLRVARGVGTVERVRDSVGCQSGGLRLEVDASPAFNASTGTVRIPIVMRNLSGSPVIARARVRFDADSSRFADAKRSGGGARPNVVAINYDSATASGRSGEWRFDTLLASPELPQVLMPNAVSRRRWLELLAADGNARVQITLWSSATLPPQFPTTVPDSTPAFLRDYSNLRRDDDGGLPYFPHHLLVLFHTATSSSVRAATATAIGGRLAGGARFGNGEGYYILRIPVDSIPATLDSAIARLKRSSAVRYAGKDYANPAVPAGGEHGATVQSDAQLAQSRSDTAILRRNRYLEDRCLSTVAGRHIPHCVLVVFRYRTTRAQRSAAISAIGGIDVGNSSGDDSGGGFFTVRVPNDSTWQTVDRAIARFKEMQVVQDASRIMAFEPFGVEDAGRHSRPALPLCPSCVSDARALQHLVPVPPPDSVPVTVLQALRADSNITHDDAPQQAGRYPRNVVLVTFHPTATQRQRTDLLRSVRGIVLGGFPIGIGGMYYVRIDGPGTTRHLFQAIGILRASPLVKRAMVDQLDAIQPVPIKDRSSRAD